MEKKELETVSIEVTNYYCDMCGKKIEKEGITHPHARPNQLVLFRYPTSTHYCNENEYHVCLECQQKIQDWMFGVGKWKREEPIKELKP